MVGDLLHTCPKQDYDHSPGLLLLNNQRPQQKEIHSEAVQEKACSN